MRKQALELTPCTGSAFSHQLLHSLSDWPKQGKSLTTALNVLPASPTQAAVSLRLQGQAFWLDNRCKLQQWTMPQGKMRGPGLSEPSGLNALIAGYAPVNSRAYRPPQGPSSPPEVRVRCERALRA